MPADLARQKRQERILEYVKNSGMECAVIQDIENRRNSSVFYLSGMPEDTLCFLFRKGKIVLVPWDVILAGKMGTADEIVPFSDFQRETVPAIRGILEKEGVQSGRLELSSSIPHLMFLELRRALPGMEIIVRTNGIDDELLLLRSVKEQEVQDIYRKAAAITDSIIGELADGLFAGTLKTESDVALYIEKRSREMGCEGTGFETIAAGPGRSFGIHAYPGYTGASVENEGFTIIDFGVKLEGYTTDVTLTLARGRLSELQNRMCRSVQEAHDLAAELLAPGAAVADIAEKVDSFFKEKDLYMPHSLGHGIGLDAHETPVLKSGTTRENVLKPGMIVTLEPGLYDEECGGVRLENDYLITASGAEQLTNSRILFDH